MKYQNQTLSYETLTLPHDKVTTLGPNLILNSCILQSETTGEGIILAGVKLNSCKFYQKIPLSNFQFERIHLKDVTFYGTFLGCDFGDWDSTQSSSVEDCDFTQTELDGCRFLNCNMSSIKLPEWPNISFILNQPSHKSISSLIKPNGPLKLKEKLNLFLDQDPECKAIVISANTLSRKCDLSLDELKKVLMK